MKEEINDYTFFYLKYTDIVDGNVKIILGMLWRLIQKFQLSQDNSRAALLKWCKTLTSERGVTVENFQARLE